MQKLRFLSVAMLVAGRATELQVVWAVLAAVTSFDEMFQSWVVVRQRHLADWWRFFRLSQNLPTPTAKIAVALAQYPYQRELFTP